MEVPLEEEDEVARAEERPPEVEVLNASDEAINFLASIEVAELQKCVFSDSLATVSEGGRELGQFTVTVEVANRFQKPCLLLRAQSQGAIDSTPCGTSITAYLSTDLETLEQDHHEYVKLEGHRLDRRCHMSQHNGQMRIDKVTSVGEEVTKESVSYPLSILRGLVTEGANLLLMRLLSLRRKVPDNMTFLSLDQESRLTHTIYSELGLKQLETGCETVEVFGLERKINSVEDMAVTWHCYFLPDGHLASRVQIGSPVTMKLVLPPSELTTDLMEEKLVFENRPLVWEEDMQMRSKFLDRKEELKADHASYLREHPELRALMADFLQLLLLKKPDDIFMFAREYFLPFASRRTLGQNLKTPLI